ncbi:MAG TPA: class I SAM-dependent methyltransferase [Acidobacteriaceae bacterium]
MGLFKKKLKQEHKIMLQHDRAGGALQPEYHRATPECPHPEQWSMFDSMTAELEVLELLATLVTTLKPKLVVETGSFLGVSTEWIARALERNAEDGRSAAGKVISCEYDPQVYARAKQRFERSPLARFVDLRNESSLEIAIDGTIDLLFSDSDPNLREAEVRRFLPQMKPDGLILIHDASSHLETVREAAKKMEREGLISILLLPTPRGLVLAQPKTALA